MKDNQCQKCKGKGWYETVLRDLAGRQPHGLGIPAIVPCDIPGCRDGIVNREENYRSFRLYD